MRDAKLAEALRLVGVYSGGRFDLWALAGPAKASCRAHVMSAFTGAKVPQSKAGVFAIQAALFGALNPPGDCQATRDENFRAMARAYLAEPVQPPPDTHPGWSRLEAAIAEPAEQQDGERWDGLA
jgi:hypothetical protein